jgi:MFS superfamily sulfate permease-like transporter
MLAFRVEAGIAYFNTEHIFDTVLARVEAERQPPRLCICDLSTSPVVDLAGARMFLTLHEELARRGIALRLVEARSSVRDMLRGEGVEDKVGRIDRFQSLADVVEHPQLESKALESTNHRA